MLNRSILLAIMMLSCLLSSLASAAPRTVCFRLQLRDDRSECPWAGFNNLNELQPNPCHGGSDPDYTDFAGAVYQVWDKDSTGSDELITGAVVSGSGIRAIAPKGQWFR